MTALLVATGISKSYGWAKVLDEVDFDVRPGEVHALVGENGAGKSTLIRVLTGAIRPDAGQVRLGGELVHPDDPRAARRRGISCVYQEFTLVPDMSVADNIALGREHGPFLHTSDAGRAAAARLRDLGARCSPQVVVRDLPVAEQQLVEIARALETDARVLVLDEPTASLPAHEVDRLLDLVRSLRQAGLGIVYVSHRFAEIYAIADRITVLRDGRVVGSGKASALHRAQVIRWMVGRDISEEFPPRLTSPGRTVLEVCDLTSPGRFRDVSFSLRAGEILGLAGLVGAGRTSLGLALAGAAPSRGRIALDARDLRPPTPAHALAAGVAYLTEDRKGRGLIPAMNAASNLTLASLKRFAPRGIIDRRRERAAAVAAAQAVHVRPSQLDQPAGTLSGGTQQKVLFGRTTIQRPKVLILDEPTRGVDAGARAEIYQVMNRLTSEGVAILMISSDLPELLGISDRVLVMRSGTVTGELTGSEMTGERVMSLATGA